MATVRADEAASNRVSDILNRHSPVDIEEREESWRQTAWSGFDERAEPHSEPVHRNPPAGAPSSALQRDWEARRDPSEVGQGAGRSYVRIYPRVEEPVGDKR